MKKYLKVLLQDLDDAKNNRPFKILRGAYSLLKIVFLQSKTSFRHVKSSNYEIKK